MMEVESMNDMIRFPLNEISNIIKQDESIVRRLTDIGESIKSKLTNGLSKVPSINNSIVENIPPKSLVCFRGMIQDMFDPEFYLGQYSVTNKTTQEKSIKTSCFTDISENSNEEIDFECASNVTLERQTYVCVPIPGENKWMKDIYKCNGINIENGSVANKKRMHDDIKENNVDGTMDVDNSPSKTKKLKAQNGAANGTHNVLNGDMSDLKVFPLPDETGTSCLVKMYSECVDLKLNDVIEFYGVLADPQAKNNIENEEMPMIDKMYDSTPFSASSKIPTIHCLFFNKLDSPNTIIKTSNIYDSTIKELASVRNDLIQLLTRVFGGDATVAEYFLLHLISKTYAVVGTLCVGKFSLNITKCPGNLSQLLYGFLQKVAEKSYMLPMSIDNLNKMKFTPKKDHEKNQLVSGVLQLSAGTNLVLDETVMQPGTLDATGVNNLKAIGNLIQWQSVEYDFTYSRINMKTDVNVMIFSEGRSMLKCDCQIPLTSDNIDIEEAKSFITNISSVLLDKFRIYLACIQMLEFNLTEEVSKALEDDFVEMRKTDPSIMTAEAFSILLTTARYMALSYGNNKLDASLWTRAKDLDVERRKRSS